ncbi:MAG TPA: fibronectin type III domain-containing protein [Ignavibacteria bacterium]|nr:fibronectin type III domain-containing protein [Ignavibacteria bacterium]
MNQKVREGARGESRKECPNGVFAAKGTFPGEINLQWDAVENARSYVLQMSKGKNGKWSQVDIISEPYYMLSGLDDKTEYSFRVAAVFKESQGEWSEVFTKKR